MNWRVCGCGHWSCARDASCPTLQIRSLHTLTQHPHERPGCYEGPHFLCFDKQMINLPQDREQGFRSSAPFIIHSPLEDVSIFDGALIANPLSIDRDPRGNLAPHDTHLLFLDLRALNITTKLYYRRRKMELYDNDSILQFARASFLCTTLPIRLSLISASFEGCSVALRRTW